MIHGIGTDIIEVKRIESAISRFGQRFLDRLFTVEEQAYCNRHRDAARHFAGRFAAKEAIVKALGTGFREGINWLDVTVRNDDYGKPVVSFSSRISVALHSPNVLVSISHSHDYATAFAICLYAKGVVESDP